VPAILTTTVGSYPVPEWLTARPSEQSLVDATRVVFDIQRQAGIDLPTDGQLYRFDVNHPDTNGMIEFFVHKLGGICKDVGRRETATFRAKAGRISSRGRSGLNAAIREKLHRSGVPADARP
jgi:5-methyltetrahydropteroyltriglutamate--homocysteine methyltransferase